MTLSTPIFRLSGLRVERAGRRVLDVAALDLARGAVTALVGPNGAGKSTLLRVLACLEPPDAGSLAFDGEALDPRGREAARRRVTYLGPAPYLFRGSVRRNVAYGLRAHGRRDDGRVARALAAVGLDGFADRPARKLSSGEAQRVALARALAIDPAVYLLDEPTASIDRATLPLVEALIERLRADGRTVVLSTHDLDQAYRLADAVLALDDGRVHPAPVMTVLRGRTGLVGEDPYFDSGGLRIEMPRAAHPTAIAIDADDVLVSRAPLDSSARNRFHGTIVAVAEDPRGVLLTIDCGHPLQARITPHSYQTLGLGVGVAVWVAFKASAIHVLRNG
jgi:molybdopterin-binding protein